MTRSAVFVAALMDPAAAVPQGLGDGAGRPAGRRFDVYRNNVAAGLSDALETAFPVIRKLVGDAFFRALAGVHLRAHPPASPLMMHYGDDMPAFLARFPPVSRLPYLPDIARIELALRRAYHAADVAPVDPATIAALDPAAIAAQRMTFAPAVSLIASDWPVHAIWHANTAGGSVPADAGPQAVMITRRALDPTVHLIDRNVLPVLSALIAGQPLGAAAEAGPDDTDPLPLLSLLLAEGAVTAIH